MFEGPHRDTGIKVGALRSSDMSAGCLENYIDGYLKKKKNRGGKKRLYSQSANQLGKSPGSLGVMHFRLLECSSNY